jgi:hypothetical protein
LFLIFHFILNVYAGKYIPDVSVFIENRINLLYEKNVTTDIKTSTNTLDVYYDKSNTDSLKPVIIFVHGGGWFFGSKSDYSRMGSMLVKEDYVGVIINHVLFPKGSMDDMVDDVYNSVQWVYNNISKYGGNKNKIILTGHSSGAHLAALTTFKSSLGIKNNGKILEPLPELHKLVLFNGPYDFDDYDIGKIIGINEVEHGITERLTSLIFRSETISPTDILKKYDDDSITSLGASIITLYSADKDDAVPYSSADNLSKQIRRISPSTTLNFIYTENKNYDHFTLISGVIRNNSELQQMFIDICEI